MEQANVSQPEQQSVTDAGTRLRAVIHILSAIVGLASTALLTYLVASLADIYYVSRHAVPAPAGTGDELGLELAVIFAMIAGFAASVPAGFFVYRFASKRLLKGIFGD
jgi:hypothetical protein